MPGPEEIPPDLRSSPMKDPLHKTQQKDTWVPKEKMWARDLIKLVPADQLGRVTEFINGYPPELKEKAANVLFGILHERPQSILRSDDPEAALIECIEETKDRMEN